MTNHITQTVQFGMKVVRSSRLFLCASLGIALLTGFLAMPPVYYCLAMFLLGFILAPILFLYYRTGNVAFLIIYMIIFVGAIQPLSGHLFPNYQKLPFYSSVALPLSLALSSVFLSFCVFRRKCLLSLGKAEQDGPPNDPPLGSFKGGPV